MQDSQQLPQGPCKHNTMPSLFIGGSRIWYFLGLKLTVIGNEVGTAIEKPL